MKTAEIVFLVNLVVCIAVWWVCICRLNVMGRNTVRWLRAKYALIAAGALTLAFLPMMFNLRPTWDVTAVAGLVLVLLVLDMPRWRNGPPGCCWRTSPPQE